MTDEDLRHSPLEEVHRALDAHMGPFAGWSMPIEYRGTLAEHAAVREAVGLFDLSHLGKVDVEGPGAFDLLQRTMPNDLSKVAVGGAQYNMMLNERGGIVDDLITYRVAGTRYLIVPNAANVGRVVEILRAAAGAGVSVTERPDLALIAPQGPRSTELLAGLLPETKRLRYMHGMETSYRGLPIVLSRSGYTGEVGYEVFVPADAGPTLWRELSEAGAPMGLEPCGLAARDTLRLEMGYPLHGNDISEDRTPLEAGLSWAVALGKQADFAGKEALLRQKVNGVPSRLWGLRTTQPGRIPRPHYPVLVGTDQVGETTSGSFSPTLRAGIALAYLAPRARFGPGDTVEIDIRGRRAEAVVTRPPFVQANPRSGDQG